jgi:hypothetical protein
MRIRTKQHVARHSTHVAARQPIHAQIEASAPFVFCPVPHLAPTWHNGITWNGRKYKSDGHVTLPLPVQLVLDSPSHKTSLPSRPPLDSCFPLQAHTEKERAPSLPISALRPPPFPKSFSRDPCCSNQRG